MLQQARNRQFQLFNRLTVPSQPLFAGIQRVQVIGTHAGDFTVTQHLPVSQSVGALLFTIHFDPRDRVCVRAIVEIPNNLIGNAIAAPTKIRLSECGCSRYA